jgi:hypothetical protein
MEDHMAESGFHGDDDEQPEWFVDVPDAYHEGGEWIFVASFSKKEDAIRFVKEKYGGDDEGNVCLVSGL